MSTGIKTMLKYKKIYTNMKDNGKVPTHVGFSN